MGEDRVERELRGAFQALRDEETRSTPAFEPLVRSAVRRVSRRIPPWARLAGAVGAAAALVLVLGVYHPGLRQQAVDLEAWSALSQWKAATDSLLEQSGTRLDGMCVTTPSDIWMNSARECDGPQPNRKEML